MHKSLPRLLAIVLPLCGLALPTLVDFNTGPSPSFYNEVIAYFAWGLGGYIYSHTPHTVPGAQHAAARAFVAVCILLSALAAFSSVHLNLPAGILLCSIAALASAAALSVIGSRVALRQPGIQDIAIPFIVAMATAAELNCIPALIETFRSSWVDGGWIAPAWSADRISGNIRQPNLLATFSVWGVAAIVALRELGRCKTTAAVMLCIPLLLTIAATGSRIGGVEVLALASWGLVDRTLSRRAKLILWGTPWMLLASWVGLRMWSAWSGVLHGRAPDVTSGRFAMWEQSLALIAAHPWFGVGFGNFNFAWTLTPAPRLNPETFDNAHNLILQWAVELGLPITLILVGMLALSLRGCIITTQRAEGADSIVRRFCIVMVVVVLLHSLTEYPLWYSYFLFPTAFAWGIAAAPVRSADGANLVAAPTRQTSSMLSTFGLMMALGGAFAVYDYQKIVTLYHPWNDAESRDDRILAGRHAILFPVYADRFAGTLAVKGTRTLEPYQTATRKLLDFRLMMSWALALQENGETDKARYIAQRLRDFNDPVAQQFFSKCSEPPAASIDRPFQCSPPRRTYTYADFL